MTAVPPETQTANYGWIKPFPTGSTSTWGATLNSDLDAIDAQVFGMANPASLIVNSTPGTSVKGTLTFQNSSAASGQRARWAWVLDTAAESGGNVGSNFSLAAYSDTGAQISTPMSFTRSNGAIAVSGAFAVTGAVTHSGTTVLSGAVTCSTTFGVNGLASLSGGLNVAGATALGGSLTVGTTVAVTGSLFSNGNLSTNGTLTVQGATTIYGPLVMGSSVGITGNSGQPAYSIYDGSSVQKAQFYWNVTTNNVGIYHVGSGQVAYLDNIGQFNITHANAFKPGGGSWLAPSDERIKDVLGDYTPGLDEVLQLRPIIYAYRGNDAPPDGVSPNASAADAKTEFAGFVAQELEQIFPGMVSQREGYVDGEPVTDLRDVDVSSLLYALVNCVKQLKAEIEALKTA